MSAIYKKFCTEEFDENGTLVKFSIQCPDTFNFAYDVTDALA